VTASRRSTVFAAAAAGSVTAALVLNGILHVLHYGRELGAQAIVVPFGGLAPVFSAPWTSPSAPAQRTPPSASTTRSPKYSRRSSSCSRLRAESLIADRG